MAFSGITSFLPIGLFPPGVDPHEYLRTYLLPWLNFDLLIIVTMFYTFFYVRSVSPGWLELHQNVTSTYKRSVWGKDGQCQKDRRLACHLMILSIIPFCLCKLYPLPIAARFLPDHFDWLTAESMNTNETSFASNITKDTALSDLDTLHVNAKAYWLAGLIIVACVALMTVGVKTLEEETAIPEKTHELSRKGVYRFIRHPQALGEWPLYHALGILLNSPFLVILATVLYLPLWWFLCVSEEADLLRRYGSSTQCLLSTS